MLKLTSVSAAFVVASSAIAAPDVYNDAQNDLFDNGFANLDIASVTVTNTATDITFSVATRGFANWTKYLFFINSGGPNQTGTNGWNRPVDLNGQTIDHFIGSWVDAPASNAQLWSFSGAWNHDSTFSNDQSLAGSNIISWTTSLASLGLGFGSVVSFDVGTSGGGDFDTTGETDTSNFAQRGVWLLWCCGEHARAHTPALR